ncbi:hypothetical protein EB796_015918 [Bugula neritina]|uniref:Uncharacterized protein n=1 Tax=Bugula neritina TaxID=10212 RepID=A0A7J7JHX2_BUGNE|nr:hypothetical protein EB796_015918 [Bugula neritina]
MFIIDVVVILKLKLNTNGTADLLSLMTHNDVFNYCETWAGRKDIYTCCHNTLSISREFTAPCNCRAKLCFTTNAFQQTHYQCCHIEFANFNHMSAYGYWLFSH